MNNDQQAIKKMVAFPNGAKAMLIFRGKYARKAFIEFYQPSARYFEHIKGRTRQICLKDIGKPIARLNLNKVGTHFYLIGLHLSVLFDNLINPEADDAWLDDTEQMQLEKASKWQRRPEKKKHE